MIRIGHRIPPSRRISRYRRNAGGDAAVDRHEQAGRARQVAADERDDGVGDVLGQHLPAEQRSARVELAESSGATP